MVRSLPHSGEKGHECEEILKNFLKEYLPQKYSITSGFIFNHNQLSQQSDILLYDAHNFPILFTGYANKIIYYQSLKAVIECTTFLSNDKIKNDNEKFVNFSHMYNRDQLLRDAMNDKAPLKILFAYDTNLSDNKILHELNSLEDKCIDLLICLKRGLYEKTNGKYIQTLTPTTCFSGETKHGYTLSLEERAFHLFMIHLMMYLDPEYAKDKLHLDMEFCYSSNYIDYK